MTKSPYQWVVISLALAISSVFADYKQYGLSVFFFGVFVFLLFN